MIYLTKEQYLSKKDEIINSRNAVVSTKSQTSRAKQTHKTTIKSVSSNRTSILVLEISGQTTSYYLKEK